MDVISTLRTALTERYEIQREIGAGGMATVYLARDLRHDRSVALKVLNPELGAVLGVERFLAEIKVTANLQHPNLLPLFDSGEAQGLLFYVMPFVEGESLRARLDREKQLPIDEAIRIAVAVANALDYAHSHHVIHRDLKPENILLQHGQPVVADFGIALAVSKAGGSRVTQTGLSLGTPQYMSPEQATGDRIIDGRTDIYSLGAMTYEMLSGEPPHIGHSSQAIIARLLTDKPRGVRMMRSAVPEHVDATVARSLEKLPADRFSTAKEFADALQGRGHVTVSTATATAAAPGRAPWQERVRDPLTLALAGVAVAAIAVAVMKSGSGPEEPTMPPVRFVMYAPDSIRPFDNFPWPAAISPDGRTVVFSVGRPGMAPMLYQQRTDQLEARPIPGTADAYQPYFSPDGDWLAFQQATKDKKVRLDGSAPVTIADGASANGATWTINDEIVSGATLNFRGLARVSASGGVMTEFTHPDTAKSQRQHVWPVATPDGQHVVFTIWYGNLDASQLAVASLSDGRVSELGIKGIRPLAVLDGYMVYLQADGTIMAARLDAKGGRITGNALPVHDPVPVVAANNGNSGAFLSEGGALVTSRGNVQSQLSWLGRDGGSRRPILPAVRSYFQPRLSPDGRRLTILVAENQRTDVWVYDFTTTTFSRLTTSGTITAATWSSNGSRVIYAGRGERDRTAFWSQSVSGSAPEKLMEVSDLAPSIAVSSDGRWLVYQGYHNNTWDLFHARLDTTPVTEKSLIATTVNEFQPQFSPDGKWVAFISDESGRPEVYVRSFPDPAARMQISAEGALDLIWPGNGRLIYYRSGSALLTATVEFSPAFRVVRRDTLLTTQMPNANIFGATYDVAPDGRIVTLFSDRNNFELVVSPNWITEFREKVAASERTGRR